MYMLHCMWLGACYIACGWVHATLHVAGCMLHCMWLGACYIACGWVHVTLHVAGCMLHCMWLGTCYIACGWVHATLHVLECTFHVQLYMYIHVKGGTYVLIQVIDCDTQHTELTAQRRQFSRTTHSLPTWLYGTVTLFSSALHPCLA